MKFRTNKGKLDSLKASQEDYSLINKFQEVNKDTSLYMKTIINKLRNAIIHQTVSIKRNHVPFESADNIQTLVDIFESHNHDDEDAIDGKNTNMLKHRHEYDERIGAFKYLHEIHDRIDIIR